MTMEQLSAFLGWMTVLNIAWLSLAWLFVWLRRPWITALVRHFIPLEEAEVERSYFRWLICYELGIYLFNLMPWLALQIIR